MKSYKSHIFIDYEGLSTSTVNHIWHATKYFTKSYFFNTDKFSSAVANPLIIMDMCDIIVLKIVAAITTVMIMIRYEVYILYISGFLDLLKVRLPWILLSLHIIIITLLTYITITLTHKLTLNSHRYSSLAHCCRTTCCTANFAAEGINVQQTITLEKPD